MSRAQIGEGFVEFTADDARFQRTAARVAQSTERLGRRFEAAGRLATRMLAVSTAAIAGLVKLAADAEESESRFRAVFRGSAEDVRAWSEALANGVGRSRIEIRDAAATFQGFFVGLGFGSAKAVELSQKMVELGIDFASFNNLADDEAIGRFISALSGSGEVLDRFGVNIKQAALGQQLLEQGIKGGVSAATEQQKVIARLAIIMRAMTDQGAVGDAVRTSGSLTNQMKGLTGEFRDAGVALGNIFVPEVQRLVRNIRSLLPPMLEWVSANKEQTLVTVKMVGQFLLLVAVLPRMIRLVVALATALTTARSAVFGLVGALGALVALGIAEELRQTNIELEKLKALSERITSAVQKLGQARKDAADTDSTADRAAALRQELEALKEIAAVQQERVRQATEASAAAERNVTRRSETFLGTLGGGGLTRRGPTEREIARAADAERELNSERAVAQRFVQELAALEEQIAAADERQAAELQAAATAKERQLRTAVELLDTVQKEADAAARALRTADLRRQLEERRADEQKRKDNEAKSRQKSAEAQRKSEAAAIVEGARTPAERLKSELTKLQDFLARGLIDDETFSRAVKAARSAAAPDDADRGGSFIGLQAAFRSIQSQVVRREDQDAKVTAQNTGATVTQLIKVLTGVNKTTAAVVALQGGVPAVLP